MNWYKKAQQTEMDLGDTKSPIIDDVYDDVFSEHSNIMEEYYDKKRKKGTKMNWVVIPFARLKKIWEDFSRYGIVRDTRGLDEIVNQIMKNLARLQAATDLSGHGGGFDIEDTGYEDPGGQNIDFYFDFLSTKYGEPVSDYGLPKLWKIAEKIYQTKKYEEKLLLLDQFLNVIHERGDLAALFIEGGSQSLTKLFNN